jgi:hypothetical protein
MKKDFDMETMKTRDLQCNLTCRVSVSSLTQRLLECQPVMQAV